MDLNNKERVSEKKCRCILCPAGENYTHQTKTYMLKKFKVIVSTYHAFCAKSSIVSSQVVVKSPQFNIIS